MRALDARLDILKGPHLVGGRGFTHSIPNYGRVMREGLDGHARRVADGLRRAEAAGDVVAVEFYLGMEDVLEGIRTWTARLAERLAGLRLEDPGAEDNRLRLLEAFSRVPFAPARSFHDALVCYNLVYYLDDCDNPGRVDLELEPYWRSDLDAGRTSQAEAEHLLGSFWRNVDDNDGWCAAIGGTAPDGSAFDSSLTLACLRAARGMRRPNLQLGVRPDAPPALLEEALRTVATGCGLPALLNDRLFDQALRAAGLEIPDDELAWRSGGGCTETMIHGRSNVGSLDAGINLPLVLEGTLADRLESCANFAELLEEFHGDVAEVVEEVTEGVNADQRAKAALRPQPMRSLLVDDCIERGRDFNDGGARYNWSVVNVAGLANAIDSLAAIREAVYERKDVPAPELLSALREDFRGHEPLRRRLARAPKYGNDDPRADDIAEELSGFVFGELLRRSPWRGGRFLPSCLMFTTYAEAGAAVGATADGRRACEPLADSAGPYQGRDRTGPTAMLRSVARIRHALAPGTLVVNIRFTPDILASEETRGKVADLALGFFSLGGMQLQVNVVDQRTLQDAMEHPERHEDLIVRIGGYSEYFTRLSPELRRTVLERTAHRL
jgi:formate C-acetyltransferase